MMGAKRLTALAALALAGGVCAATGDYYQWRGAKNDWRSWGEASNWYVTNATTQVSTDATTPPGADDLVQVGNAVGNARNTYPQYIWANLGGQDWTLKGLDLDNGWRNGSSNVHLTNGTLTVTGTYEFYGDSTENAVWNGATLTIARTVAHGYEGRVNASYPLWTVKNGGALNLMPDQLDLFNSYHVVEAGGTLRLEPRKVSWVGGGGWPNRYVNYGTLVLTNGFDMTGSASPENAKSTMSATSSLRRNGLSSYVSFDHLGGTLRLGGVISNGGLTDGGYFMTWRNVCAVDVVRDLSFVGFECAVSNNATVALTVAENAKADLSSLVYGSNTTLTKAGAGTVVVGANGPASFTVAAGAVEVTSPSFDLSTVAFADGTRIVFGCNGRVRADALANAANLDFEIDADVVSSGTEFFASSSAELRARVKAQVALHLPATLEVVEDGESLYVFAKEENVIDVTPNVSLSDYPAYAGKPVVLRGHGVATLGASAPAFASLALELGATLKVDGGTESAPIDLPPLDVAYNARLVVADGAYALLTNGWSFAANDESIGVFEIETNGIAYVQDPAWPDKSIVFKNVDFRLYGQLRVPTAPGDNAYIGSQMYFGYAASGETGHVAFRAEGGSIYAHHTAAAYVGNLSLVAIASPAAGGRVKVHGDVLFRDFRKIQNLDAPDNPQISNANSGYFFGANNPADETFNVVVDDTLLAPGGPTKFAGGSHTVFRNGSSLMRPEFTGNQSFGHTRGVWICDAASVSFEGGRLYLDRPCGSATLGRGLNVSTTSAGTTTLSLADGVKLTLWETWGVSNAVCEVADATFTVPRMLPPRMGYSSAAGGYVQNTTYSQTNTPAFNGFGRVNIVAGGRLVFDASDDYAFQSCNENAKNPLYETWWTDWWEWHRKTALERPITGAGDMIVTNSLAGVDGRNLYGYVSTSVTNYPDISYWEMNLVMRCPSNTCTGVLRAETNAKSFVQFADGANWAGTVVGNSHIRLGDSIAELDSGEAPATATFGALRFEDDFPIRLWNDGTAKTNDFVEIAGACTAVKGGLVGVGRNAYEPDTADWFRVGRCLKSSPPPAARNWLVKLVDDPADATRAFVNLKYTPAGTIVVFR